MLTDTVVMGVGKKGGQENKTARGISQVKNFL